MKSIRRELTWRILAGTFLMLLLSGAAFCVVIHARVLYEFDRALAAKAGALVALTSREARTIEVDFDEDAMPEFRGEEEEEDEEEEEEAADAEYFQIFLEDATVVRKSPSLGKDALPFDEEFEDDPKLENLRLPDGRRGRLVQVVFVPRTDDGEEEKEPLTEGDLEELFELPTGVDEESIRLAVVVARSRDGLDALLGSLYLAVALLMVLLLVGVALLVRKSVRHGFRPIDDMNDQIRRIGPDTLDGRVGLASPPEELHAILAALNGLLERVESGFMRERRFSSDVAHELRTPVAELRTACEVGAKWPDDPASVRRFFDDVREIARQMEHVVTNLLALARCDNGTARVNAQPVAVQKLVRDCVQRVAADAAQKGLRVENRMDSSLCVESDRDKLEQVLQNLLANAVAYGAPDTPVVCACTPTDSGVDLLFTNRAIDLAREDLEHVFERFWQKDPARGDGERSGLGLPIVKELCHLLGIGLHVDLTPDDIFEVRLSFPSASLR